MKDVNMKDKNTIASEIIDKMIIKEEEDKIKSQNILKDFGPWAEKFTINYEKFADDDFLYKPEAISDEDKEFVNNLNLLFNAIDKYAKKNFIYPTKCEIGVYYKIKYGDTGYAIGYSGYQGGKFFCHRVNIDDNKQFINLDDIINNRTITNVEEIQTYLDDLSLRICYLYYNKGVPVEAIQETICKTINSFNNEEQDNKIKTHI